MLFATSSCLVLAVLHLFFVLCEFVSNLLRAACIFFVAFLFRCAVCDCLETEMLQINWSNVTARPTSIVLVVVVAVLLLVALLAASLYSIYRGRRGMQHESKRSHLSLSVIGHRSYWTAFRVRHPVMSLFYVSRFDVFDRSSRIVALFTDQLVCETFVFLKQCLSVFV